MGREQKEEGGLDEKSHSSVGSGSQGASSSIASSSHNGKKGPPGATFFTLAVPMVPFFTKLDVTNSRLMVMSGQVISVLQLFGWILNPNMKTGGILRDLGEVLYATHIPLWDRSFGNIGFSGAVGPLWAVVLLEFLMGLGCYVYWNKQDSELGKVFAIFRGMVHASSSWLFVPMSTWLLAFIVCDKRTDKLWAMDQDCGTALQVPHAIVAVLALVVLWLGSFLVQTMLFSTDPRSGHCLARSHSRLDKVVMVWRMGTMLAFHLLMAQGLRTWFALYIAVTCLLLGLSFAFVMPYWMQITNERVVASYITAAYFGLVVFIDNSGYAGEDFTRMQGDAVFALGLSPVVYCTASWMASARVSVLYKAHLANFVAGHVAGTPVLIPAGLEKAGPYQPVDAIETELPDSLGEEGACTGGAQEHFLVPMLSRLWLQTDIEVATRFVSEYTRLSGNKPSPQMTLAGARLFAKGVTVHKQSDLLVFQLALFLCTHNRDRTPVLRFTLHHLLDGAVARSEAALSVRYQTHVLGTWIRSAIGYKDNSHIKLWRSAQKLHREALGQMGTFWARLLGAKVDTVQLAVIANGITTKRQQANVEFQSVLGVTREPQVVFSYASFLEQVMLDDEAAKLCRDAVNEQTENKVGKEDILLRAKMSEGLTSSTGDATREHLGQLTRTLNVTFLILFVLVGGFFIYDMVLGGERKKVLESTAHAGAVRSLAQRAGFLTMGLCVEEAACDLLEQRDGVTQATDAPTSQEFLKQQLGRTLADFKAHHSILSWGSSKATFPPLIEFNKWPTSSLEVGYDEEKRGLRDPPEGTIQLYSLWNLGYDMAERLWRVLDTTPTMSAPHRVAAYEWIIDNLDGPIDEMFNRSVAFHSAKGEQEWFLGMSVLTALFVSSLLIIQIVYVVLILNFQQIEQSKLGALNLFTLIPNFELARLHRRARALASSFDFGSQKFEEEEISELSDADELELLLTEGDEHLEEEGTEREDHVDLGTALPVCVSLLGVLILAALGLTLSVMFLLPDYGNNHKEKLEKYKLLSELSTHQHQLRSHVQNFIQFGHTSEYVKFLESAVSVGKDDLSQKFHEGASERLVSLLGTARYQENILEDTGKTVLRLGAKAFDLEKEIQGSLMYHTWSYNESLGLEYAYKGLRFRPSEVSVRRLNHSEYDLALSSSDQLTLAKNTAFGSSYFHEFRRWGQTMYSMWLETEHYIQMRMDQSAFKVLIISLIAVYSTVTWSGIIYVSRAMEHQLLLRGPVLQGGCALFFLSAAVALGLTIEMHLEADNMIKHIETELQVMETLNKTTSVIRELSDNARFFSHKGDRAFYQRFWNVFSHNTLQNDLIHVCGGAETEQYKAIHQNLNLLHKFHTISLTLRVWGNGIDSLAWKLGTEFPEIANVRWNFNTEDEKWNLRGRFPDEKLWYSTTRDDVVQPPELQVKVAQSTVFNGRYLEVLDKTMQQVAQVFDSTAQNHADLAEDSEEYMETLLQSVLALCIVQWICALLYITNLTVMYMQSRCAIRGGAANSHLSESKVLVRRSQLALGVVFLCLVGVYIIGVIGLNRFRQDTPRIDVASARSWTVARALAAATRLTHTAETKGDRRKLTADLERALDDIERYRTELYHGKDLSDGQYNGVQSTSKLNINGVSRFCRNP